MITIEKIGRFSICENREKLYLRWWNLHAKRTESERLDAETIEEARKVADERIRVISDPIETVSLDSGGDPTFAEVWLAFEQEKRKKLGAQRFRLLENRKELYYKVHLWNVRMSKMGPALRTFVTALEEGTTPPRKFAGTKEEKRKGVPFKPRPLHPNTISDIISSAIEVCAIAKSDGVSAHNPPRKPFIAGTTAPENRDPKGRYISFEEIGKLIDACRRPHMRDLMLLDLGSGARIGAVADLCGDQIYHDLGVIDLLADGEIENNKRRPIVPISGPMGRILRRLIEEYGEEHLIREAGRPIALGSRNWTQMIQRIVKRSKIDEKWKPGKPKANWYSVRRTFADFLDEYASDGDISSVLGHFETTKKTRGKIFDRGSPTSIIYKRRKLAPALRIGEILDREWWPRIQEFTEVNVMPDGPIQSIDAAE